MQVYTNIDELPHFRNAVITIGTFDGVHLGHSKIIAQLLREAREVDGTAVLITFFPHPKRVVNSNKKPLYILSTQREKYQLLREKGIEHVVVIPFDKQFSEQTAMGYIKDFLVDKFHPHTIIIGYDHRFGCNREGDFKLLELEAERYHFKVKEIPERLLEDVIISSTKVRNALLEGDLETAAAHLGYNYFFSGTVIEGDKLGRTIGYPTANLQVDDMQKLIPANGVYVVDVELSTYDSPSRRLNGMMNIGVRPTVDGSRRMIEINLFHFEEMIYGADLKVTFRKKLRDEVKFDGLESLKAQLAKDKIAAMLYLQG